MLGTGRMLARLAFDWTDSNLTYGVGLAFVLLIGAAAIALVKRWRQQNTSDILSPSDQLAEFRSLYEQGTMSKEEFERLRALLGGQLREPKPPDVPIREPETGAILRLHPEAKPVPPWNEGVTPSPPAVGDRPT